MLTQDEADEQFELLREGLKDTKFEPSDVFEAIADALYSGFTTLGAAIADNAKMVLEGLTEEKDWHDVSLEVFRRTFYSVEDMEKNGMLQYIPDKTMLITMTQYLICALHGMPFDLPVRDDRELH